MSSFRVDVDLSVAADAINGGAERGLTLALEHLLTEANKSVPHDEGTLERSGSTSVDMAAKRGAVSYDTPYAVRQHEDLDLSHDGKGEAKWLESTMVREASTVGKIVQQQLANELGG